MKQNLPQRKQIRLKEYDYSQEGYYFITICTKNRIEILGKIDCRGRRPRRPAKNNIIRTRENRKKAFRKI